MPSKAPQKPEVRFGQVTHGQPDFIPTTLTNPASPHCDGATNIKHAHRGSTLIHCKNADVCHASPLSGRNHPWHLRCHRKLDLDQQSASTRDDEPLITLDKNSRIDIAFF